MNWKTMQMICSAHHKRGEQVKEFNLSPLFFNKLKKKEFIYRNRLIPIISDSWQLIDYFYCRELKTSEGILYIKDLTYTIL